MKLVKSFIIPIMLMFSLSGCSEHEHLLEKIDKVDATCLNDGHEEYYKCKECEKLFSDAEGKNEISAIPVLTALGHNIEKRYHKEPTCYEEGHEDYSICTRCETIFDINGANELDAIPYIAKIDHHFVDGICEYCNRPTLVDKSEINQFIQTVTRTFNGVSYDEGDIVPISPTSDPISITEAGVYSFSGSYSGGLSVNASLGEVIIILNDADISKQDATALTVGANTDIVVVSPTNTNNLINSLKVGSTKADAINVSANLIFEGSGLLRVESNTKNGINASKGKVIVKDSSLVINGKTNGVSSLGFEAFDAHITITAGTKDAIKTEVKTDYTINEGYVYLDSTTLVINSAGDGIQTDVFVFVKDSTIQIATHGEFVFDTEANREKYDLKDDDFEFDYINDDYVKVSSDNIRPDRKYYALTQSCKGIRTGGLKDAQGELLNEMFLIHFDNSHVTINSTDDCVNSKGGHLHVDGGEFHLTSYDDGLTSNLVTFIEKGTFVIDSYEGIEGQFVEILDGTFSIETLDDCINASSDGENDLRHIYICGGSFNIYSSGDGDAIDANGRLIITGGSFSIDSKTQEALDSDDGTFVDGGSILACTWMQVDNKLFSQPQKLSSILLRVSFPSGSQISVYKGSQLLANKTALFDGNCIYVSNSNIQRGDNIVIRVNEADYSFSVDDVFVYQTIEN